MSLEIYKENIRAISQRIVEAQRPLRVLDSIKWDPSIEAHLRKSNFKDIPKVDADYYLQFPLGYDPSAKKQEFKEIILSIKRDLGERDPLAVMLIEICDQYHDVVCMLQARGTKKFWEYSKKLYGSPKDRFLGDLNTIADLGNMLYSIWTKTGIHFTGEFPEDLTDRDAVRILNERFKDYFKDDAVHSRLSDGIVADAAAGSDVVKIKEGARFSKREVDLLEVHEGWVHIGTTLNGSNQKYAKWLSKGPPRVSSTQEGLAVIVEIFTFRSYPKRAKQINDRILGIDKAEDGANVLDLIEFYRTEGYSEEDVLVNAKRVFRGGVLTGGAPFTKDIAYCKGFIENYNFMRAAMRSGKPHLIPFLFAGKTHVEDVPLLYQKYKEGIIDPPRYLPPQFRDLNGLAVWMSFSNFLNMVDLQRVQEHYDRLFQSFS